MSKAVYLEFTGTLPEGIDGKTFQIHTSLTGKNVLTLYEVTLDRDAARCPVVVGGERCGMGVGHDGKHMWGRGD